MKWLLTSKKSGQEIYELWNDKENLLTLTLTSHHKSGGLRITTADEKRVFLVGKEGFLRSRTVLRNEYGIRIGQLSYENNDDNTGIAEFNNERVSYSIQNPLHPELVITKNEEIITSCELPPVSNKKFQQENYDQLILALGWYLLGKQVEEYV